MPKLISIKRPFAKKTADLKNGNPKYMAEIMKSVESSCTELAKVASKIKRVLKSSDAQKLDQLDEKIKTLFGRDTSDDEYILDALSTMVLTSAGEDQLFDLVPLRSKLRKKLSSKIDHLGTQLDDIVNKFKWFNPEFFSKPLSDAKSLLSK